MDHAVALVQAYLQLNGQRKHWNMLRHLQFKDPASGFLMTLEKARRGGTGRRGTQGVEVVPPQDTPRPLHEKHRRNR